MIISECVGCSELIMLDETREVMGTWRLLDCDSCSGSNVIEITQFGGITYTQEKFEADILPDLDDIERMDHPSGDITIYGNPEKIGMKNVE